MLLVVHTGRPAGVRIARLVAERLGAAGVGVRVLESEAGDLNCLGAVESADLAARRPTRPRWCW